MSITECEDKNFDGKHIYAIIDIIRNMKDHGSTKKEIHEMLMEIINVTNSIPDDEFHA